MNIEIVKELFENLFKMEVEKQIRKIVNESTSSFSPRDGIRYRIIREEQIFKLLKKTAQRIDIMEKFSREHFMNQLLKMPVKGEDRDGK